MSPHRVLVVDDKENMLSMFRRILPDEDVVTASNGAQALVLLGEGEPFDLIVSDIRMPGLDGMTLLEEVKRTRPEIEIVLMTAFAEVGQAVEAMKRGALDYLTKPFDPDEAVAVVQRALELQDLRREARRLKDELAQARGPASFVGSSPVMQRIYTLLSKAAASEANVLILGESGTGKELAARTIHEQSARANEPFVAVNCGALPEGLAESELFGHVEGAFTGAAGERPGLFEEAKGGTLLLDEINSLPLPIQVKLNRALEEREGRRVGSNKSYQVDVRVIAAANTDLKTEIEEGRFRDDLFYRLRVLVIELPALRDRKQDIPVLVGHFIEKLQGKSDSWEVAPDALRKLVAYRWPGNVRELRNVIESSLAVAEGCEITIEDLPSDITGVEAAEVPAEHLLRLSYKEACDVGRDQMARQYLTTLLRAQGGNVSAAAKQAGVERESLHRLLRKLGIDPAKFRKSEVETRED